jgi:hypothetical protein
VKWPSHRGSVSEAVKMGEIHLIISTFESSTSGGETSVIHRHQQTHWRSFFMSL